MKILITGVNGFIAQSLIESLDQNIYEIYGLDIQEEAISHIKKYYCVDISKEFYLDHEFDVVLHLAALNRTNVEADLEYDLFHKVNVLGTQNVALSCKYKKFVFMSSASIYDRNVEVLTEESKVNPMSKYAQTKLAAEMVCMEHIPYNKLVIVRATNVIGIKQQDVAIIPIFFKQAMRSEEIHIFVPQNRTMQLLDISDLIGAFIMIFENNINGIYNLAPENSMEIKELASRIIAICNSKCLIKIGNNNSECRAFVCSEAIKKVIDWKAKKTIQDILYDYYHQLLKKDIC